MGWVFRFGIGNRGYLLRPVVVLFLTLGALNVEAETLADALVSAYKNSKLLESTQILLRSRDEDVPQALAAIRPSFSALATAGARYQSSVSPATNVRTGSTTLPATLQLMMELTIYDGGDSHFAIYAAREGVLALRQSLIEAEQGVLLAAAKAYHDVLRQSEILQLAKSALRLTESQLRAAESRFELGEITKTDVSLVEANLAAAQSRVYLRQGELEIAKRNYELATGMVPNDLAPPPPLPSIPSSLQEAQMIAVQTHPTIKKLKHTVSTARFNLRRFETIDNPRIVFGTSVGTNRELDAFSDGTNTVSLSLTARMPFYQGGRVSSQLRQTAALAEKAAIDLQLEAEKISQNVAIAWAQLEIAKSVIPANEEQVKAVELAYQGIKQEEELGTRTIIDLLNSEQRLEEVRTSLVNSITDKDMAVYNLLERIGLMTVKHLGLNVLAYDPNVNFNRVKDAPSVKGRQQLIDTILQKTSAE